MSETYRHTGIKFSREMFIVHRRRILLSEGAIGDVWPNLDIWLMWVGLKYAINIIHIISILIIFIG